MEPGSVPRVEVIAHRTAQRFAPENSIEGVRWCAQQGFEWVEIDVRPAAGATLILAHDEPRGPQAPGGVRSERALAGAPGLVDALEEARGRIGVYLDCRACDPAAVCGAVRAADMQARVMVFPDALDSATLNTFASAAIRVVHLVRTTAEINSVARRPGPKILEVLAESLTPELMDSARDHALDVECVALGVHDREETWRRAVGLGVCAIMTDEPRRLAEERRRWTA